MYRFCVNGCAATGPDRHVDAAWGGRSGRRARLNRFFAAASLLLAAASPAYAVNCSDFPNGVLDGYAGDVAPSQIQIDRNCTIRNFPASNPLDTNFSFKTQPGQTTERWLIVFENVVHTGEMACNTVAGHRIWFVNGSSSSIQEGCQNLLIPVEKIAKDNPPGPGTAAIGVPFIYTLTMPVLYDAGTGTVIDDFGSLNDLHSVTLVDDLNGTGADLTYLGHVAYWEGSGAPASHTFSNVGGVLTFDNFDIIPSGEQIVIEITLVLDDTPGNFIGKQFVNTAKWDFGRLIDGDFYEPLPGEWGISEPLTIAGPDLVMTKTGPPLLNLGQTGGFVLDVWNSGNGAAWDVTIVDRLPDGPNGGMCELTPTVLEVGVNGPDGVTPVPGKSPLVEGTDYTLSYSGVPDCELTIVTLSGAAVIGPDEHLVVTYTTELDPDSLNGVALTNFAGAVQWFNADEDITGRRGTVRSLGSGSPGVSDHEDLHTVVTALSGVFFEKSVVNLTSGQSPALTAVPGDRMRYTLRVQTTNSPVSSFSLRDDLGERNALPVFEPGSLALDPGTLPPGADASATDPSGGTNGAGILAIDGLALPSWSELQVQFEITVGSSLLDGTIVENQADLLVGALKVADSDDPNVAGQADPDIAGDEDPTRFVVQRPPAPPLTKETMQSTATIGETFAYRVTVPGALHVATLYDVRIHDDLGVVGADLEFVEAVAISGPVAWTLVNSGTASELVLEDASGGIDLGAGEQAVVEIRVRLSDSAVNVAGLEFTNSASYTYNQLDADPGTVLVGEAGTSGPMTIVEPDLTLEKQGPLQMRLGEPGEFVLDVHNRGTSPAYAVQITDLLPHVPEGGTCDAAPSPVTVQLFEADGVTAASAVLVENTEYTLAWTGDPDCTMVLELTGAFAIGAGQRLIVRYETSLDADTQRDTALTDIAGVTRWFGGDIAASPGGVREYARVITDGSVDLLDHEDAATVIEFTPLLIFEKSVGNLTSGADPATVAEPGDRLRYRLRIENASDTPADGLRVVDELDSLNAGAAFAPGTLTVVTLPTGADSSATDPSGGTSGTGRLVVDGLDIGALGDSLTIEFEVELAPVLDDGLLVLNQSQILFAGFPVALSDDPNVNGAADPQVPGDEDPTRVVIQSAPDLVLEKVSSYLGGDPSLLMAGERMRYTITVENVGTENAQGVELTDQIPANTLYVAGSTTLNGAPVADAGTGISALRDGMLVNAPQDSTPGVLNAAVADNVATVTFDVVVAGDVPNATVISNQAFVNVADGEIAEVPSDDPRTEAVDDPTRDIVGNLPLIFAVKSTGLQEDFGSPGIVDPGDVLRYRITLYNQGAIPATGVELVDNVPSDTTYVADSLRVNGQVPGVSDGGLFPLAGGLPVSSSDRTPPLPGAGEGVLSSAASAQVEFDVRVDDGVPAGTLITNQGTVASNELSDLLTDGDGNPATGPEPTVIVVGDVQQMQITKSVVVVGGGPALAGGTLEYTVTVRNIGTVPVYNAVITDDLDEPLAGQLAYVDQSATMNGLAGGVSFSGSTITADYFAENGPLASGGSIVLRFRAGLDSGLVEGTTVTNVARASFSDPAQQVEASASVDIGGVPGYGILTGTVWHDADFDESAGAAEARLAGWQVTLSLGGAAVRSTTTGGDGTYRMTGVTPSAVAGGTYSLEFRAPGAGPGTAALGRANSPFTDGMQRIDDILVLDGSNLTGLDLPIHPNGVVYDAIGRTPIAGAVVTLLDGGSGARLPDTCFDDPAQQDQVTPAGGFYKFDLNFSGQECVDGGSYVIRVVPPGSRYLAGYSTMIPPATDPATAPFDVPACPGSPDDAVPATPAHCEAQVSPGAPGSALQAGSDDTRYYTHLRFDASNSPGSAQIFNNHIPLDPDLRGAITITKRTPKMEVSRGELVPYTITIRNSFGLDLRDVNIIDRFPAGFQYVKGSARFDGVRAEPEVAALELVWRGQRLSSASSHTIRLVLAVGAGVAEGDFTNRAMVVNSLTGAPMSEVATATVRLVPDPSFDCTDVTGKVFDDANGNGYQDEGEMGIGGVRVVSARGLAATTDAHGRYHFTCATIPNGSRGSNLILKVDDRTLPSGFRLSDGPLAIERATRGKALRINFGAAIGRVVGLDLADAVFLPDGIEMRQLWRPRMARLFEELRRAPSVLRLSYLADIEAKALVERRMKALREEIARRWAEEEGGYELRIESEIFWRRGAPPNPDEVEGRRP